LPPCLSPTLPFAPPCPVPRGFASLTVAVCYLEIAPKGSKWWRFKYRHAAVEKRISLGAFPLTSLKAARLARDRAKGELATGIDPSAQRRDKKAAVRTARLQTVDAVAAAWLEHRASAWKPGTHDAISASLRNAVFPRIASRPITEVQRREIRDLVKEIESRGAGETAGRVFQRLRAQEGEASRLTLGVGCTGVPAALGELRPELFHVNGIDAALAHRHPPG
jgi:hypothetical protein